MANTFDPLLTVLMARSLMVLRQQCVMPRLVNHDLANIPMEMGDAVNLSIPSALTVEDVVPGKDPITPQDSAPSKVTVTLNQWKKTNFHLTDKERGNIIGGIPGGQSDEAVKALANNVNAYLFSLYTGVYGYVGTAGTTPFATDLSDAAALRGVLNKQLAPPDPRVMVLDVDADVKLSANPYLAAAYARGDTEANRTGRVGPVAGFDRVFWDQAVPTHAAGTAAGATTNTAGYAVGVKTVTLASAGTGTFVVGDIITFAGDTQTYVITAGDADVSNGGTISFEPGLKVAIPTSATAITRKASHVVNLGFHRDAIAFASRPLQTEAAKGNTLSVADPVSGLVLRIEMIRQGKQDVIEYDILYGASLVRRELIARLAG